MSANHTFAARLHDLRIEFELWAVAWFVTSTVLAASIYLYLQPEPNVGLWRDYLLARVLDYVGLGTKSVPGWHTPALVIQFAKERLPSEVLASWDRDFVLILRSPGYALVLLSSAFLIFFDKKS